MTKQTITQLTVMAAAAALLFIRGHRRAAFVLGGLAALVLLLSVVAPGALHTLQELVGRAGARLSSALGVVVLTVVYVLVFVPGALWLRLLGQDPLNRRFPGEAKSNWIDRSGYGQEKSLYTKPYSRPHTGGRGKGSRS
jgi:hypothetical protein